MERERLVALEGTLNFRDLGGYQTAEGRMVAWGRVFRSDNLAGLTPGDIERLADAGIRTVVDFRRDIERESAPTPPLHTDAEIVLLPIGGEAAEGREMLERIMDGEFDELGETWFADIYVQMLEAGAHEFGRVVELAADPAHHALVFHCTAGKDRTGVTAALILRTLGVPVDDVLDDYELTTRYRSATRLAQLGPEFAARGLDIDKFRPFLTAPRPVLAHALAEIDERWGGAEGYLTGPAGLAPSTLDALRAALLED